MRRARSLLYYSHRGRDIIDIDDPLTLLALTLALRLIVRLIVARIIV